MTRLPLRRRLLFGLVITIMVLVSAELGLRILGFRYERSLSYMRFNFPRPNELYQVFEPDPELLWRMRPGFEFGQGFEPLNRQGFRGPEFSKEKAPGALRVACLGDSVTFGQPDGVYPQLLGPDLAARLARPIEAMNFGVPGYSSRQGTRLLPRILRDYRPDAVIILFGWNDHWLAKGFADKDQIAQKSRLGSIIAPLRWLRLYQFLNHEVAWFREKLNPPPRILRVSPDDYETNLREMVRDCRDAGAVPILATSPSAIAAGKVPDFLTYLEFIRAKQDLAPLHNQYNELVRREAGQDRVPLADLDLLFVNQDVTTLFNNPAVDLIHPNAKGYKLLSAALADAVIFAIGPGKIPEPGK